MWVCAPAPAGGGGVRWNVLSGPGGEEHVTTIAPLLETTDAALCAYWGSGTRNTQPRKDYVVATVVRWSGKHWLLVIALGLAEAAVLIPLLLVMPSIVQGIGSWLLVIVSAVNAGIMHRFVPFTDRT